MASIDHYLEDIELASRGEEVRDSIIDAFEALNSEGPGTMAWNNITGTPDTLTGYGVSDVPASMVSGVLALNNIPPSALERVVPVADDTARFALTSSDVQNGDTVKVLSTMKLYLVVDDTSLSTEAGYEEYKAGTADSVDWSGVLNTPETLAGYGIGNAYTKDEVDDITTSEEVESAEGNPITIETDAAQYAKKTHLTLEPVQDLHGYDHPWPAGGGKNLLPMDIALMKTRNTDGTWNGNAYTINGITFTILTDDGVYAKGILLSGTASSQTAAYIYPWYIDSLSSGSYIFTTGVTEQRDVTIDCALQISGPQTIARGNNNDAPGNSFTISSATIINGFIRVAKNYTVPSGTIVYPMIRKSTESDATFAPYSNICPITPMGHRNLLAPQSIADPFVSNGITFIVNADGSVTVNGTASSNTWLLIGTAHLTAGKKYILTGGIDAGRMMQLTDYPVVNSKGFDNGSYGLVFTAEANIVYGVRAYIASGVTVNNETLYPMIRLASDPDSTFVPYGMARVGAKVTGFNIWDEEWEVGTIDSSTGQPASASNTIRAKNYIRVKPNTMYYFESSYNGVIDYYRENKEFILQDGLGAKEIITTPNNCHYIKIRMASTYGTTYNHDICINVSDAEKNGTYEPYKDYTASLDLPEPVYSGTLDLETGELVVDMEYVESPTLTSFGTAANSPYAELRFAERYTVGNGVAVSSAYRKIATNDSGYSGDFKLYPNAITIYDDRFTSAQQATGLVQGVSFAYELATPKTYQLTPQQLALFKGINNISTNAKTVQVTYRNGELATTGDIVESTEVAKRSILGEAASDTDAKLATSLAPILGNFATAETSPTSASHAVGEYLLYNNRLFRVLAAISAGQQLTIGTNIEQTSVAAELASQASAISALNSKTAGTFTVDSALSGYENNLIVAQYGKIIVINGYVNNVTLPNSRFKLGIISGVSMPNTDVRALCTIADRAYENGSQSYVTISSSGDMYIIPVGSGAKAIYMNISYIAA